MLLRAGTKNGDITCDYFIKVESLSNITSQAIFKYLEHEKDSQIAKLQKRQLNLESFVKNIKQLEKNQFFYLATTRNYAINNRYEYGGVKDIKELKNRISTYNTGRAIIIIKNKKYLTIFANATKAAIKDLQAIDSAFKKK